LSPTGGIFLKINIWDCTPTCYKWLKIGCDRAINKGTLREELGSGYFSWYSDSLWAGRSGEKILVEARFFAHVQTNPAAHPAFCAMGTGSFPWVKWPRCGVDHAPHSEVPRSREFRVCYGVPLPFYMKSYSFLTLSQLPFDRFSWKFVSGTLYEFPTGRHQIWCKHCGTEETLVATRKWTTHWSSIQLPSHDTKRAIPAPSIYYNM
jgi:hypothetical protein